MFGGTDGDYFAETWVRTGTWSADIDGDSGVTLAALTLQLADFGCASGTCVGKIDGDDDTDLSDLAILLAEFGRTCP
jgi:hypothetical protein